jgi:hypothetical protein
VVVGLTCSAMVEWRGEEVQKEKPLCIRQGKCALRLIRSDSMELDISLPGLNSNGTQFIFQFSQEG